MLHVRLENYRTRVPPLYPWLAGAADAGDAATSAASDAVREFLPQDVISRSLNRRVSFQIPLCPLRKFFSHA